MPNELLSAEIIKTTADLLPPLAGVPRKDQVVVLLLGGGMDIPDIADVTKRTQANINKTGDVWKEQIELLNVRKEVL